LEQVEKQTGQTPPELMDLPRLPECAAHVWQWFQQLSGKRQCGMSVNPISEEATGWFFHTRRISPQQWELEALESIDSAFLASVHEDQENKKAKK